MLGGYRAGSKKEPESMPRPLTRIQVLENRAFLKLLRRTANVRLACRQLGLKYGTMQHRRRVHPGFAVQVAAALVFAQVRLSSVKRRLPRTGGASTGGPSTIHSAVNGSPPSAGIPPNESVRRSLEARSAHACGAGRKGRGAYRTQGGEPVIVRLKSGKLQVRRAQAGKLTPAAEQAFLSALAGTCNVALAVAAVGAAANAFARRKNRDPAFAREMRLAIAEGYETLNLALLAGLEPEEHADWRSNDPPPIPPMSVDQVLQLMRVHQREARWKAVELETWKAGRSRE
jgi:hypothetical protein